MVVTLIALCFAFAIVVEAQTSAGPTVTEAEAFMNKAEARLAEINIKGSRANWVHDNFITDDTEAMAADANDEITAVTTEYVEQAKRVHSRVVNGSVQPRRRCCSPRPSSR